MDNQIQCKILWYQDMWQVIKDCTMTTISKDTGVYPPPQWKRKLIRCKHSPLRAGRVIIKLYNIPSYVATHLVRHHIGVEKFVSTRRTDRGYSDQVIDRNSPVDMVMDLNFEAILNISKKRLCACADAQTIKVWRLVLETIRPYESELIDMCVPECIASGYCPEFKSCGYTSSEAYENKLSNYRI